MAVFEDKKSSYYIIINDTMSDDQVVTSDVPRVRCSFGSDERDFRFLKENQMNRGAELFASFMHNFHSLTVVLQSSLPPHAYQTTPAAQHYGSEQPGAGTSNHSIFHELGNE